jgi:hypothetical protein
MSEIAAGRHARPGDPGLGDRGGEVAREAVLARAFVRLADTLGDDFDIVDFLHGLSADSVEILQAKAAGVMLADPRGGLRLIASSDERMRLLELFELQGAQGPRAWIHSPPAGPSWRAPPTAAPAGRSSPREPPARASGSCAPSRCAYART